jgi:hypothetical protein
MQWNNGAKMGRKQAPTQDKILGEVMQGKKVVAVHRTN